MKLFMTTALVVLINFVIMITTFLKNTSSRNMYLYFNFIYEKGVISYKYCKVAK